MSKGGIMGRMHKPASVSMPLYVKPQVNYHNVRPSHLPQPATA
jgi:hypothetical protein